MTANILRVLRQNPGASSVSVTGMDGAPAECPLDSIANKEENTTGGATFRAVKAIAAIVNKEFPHVKLQTLAYSGSFEPPKLLKFGDNVVVQLAIGAMDEFLVSQHSMLRVPPATCHLPPPTRRPFHLV